jgi:cytoskeleton protein RodZ
MTHKRRQRQKQPDALRPPNEQQSASPPHAGAPVSPTNPPSVSFTPVRNTPGTRPASFEAERIGDILRRKREQRGETLEAIADYLCIRPNYLAALEHSRYEELPADAYVIGFLRTYAAYLDYDGKAAIDQYHSEMAGRRRKPQLNMPQPISEGRAPTAAILVGALLAGLLIYALWYGLSTSNRAVISVPPPLPSTSSTAPAGNEHAETGASINLPSAPPPELSPLTASSPKPELPPAATAPETPPVTTASPPPAPSQNTADKNNATNNSVPPKGQVYGDSSPSGRVALRVEKESWVLIADKHGNTLFDKILKPGDIYKAPNTKGLTLTSGDGGSVVLMLDGVDLPRLTDDSRVVRGLSLDPDALKARTQATQ